MQLGQHKIQHSQLLNNKQATFDSMIIESGKIDNLCQTI